MTDSSEDEDLSRFQEAVDDSFMRKINSDNKFGVSSVDTSGFEIINRMIKPLIELANKRYKNKIPYIL